MKGASISSSVDSGKGGAKRFVFIAEARQGILLD